jgi:hypothetical protein
MGIAVRSSLDSGMTWGSIYHIVSEAQQTAAPSTESPIGPVTPTVVAPTIVATPTPTPFADQAAWFSPTIALSDAGMPIQVCIAVDVAHAGALIVWRTTEGKHLYYQTSADEGKSWSAPRQIPNFYARAMGDSYFDTYDMAVDSLGQAHLLAVGHLPADDDPYHPTPRGLYELTFDGATWSAPLQVSLKEGMYPEWPQVAVGLGNQLHVVWFERTAEELFHSESAHYQIWYASRITNAPVVTPLPQLTLVPTLPTSTPTPGTTATASPIELPPQQEQPGIGSYSESKLALPLLIGIIPVVVISLAVFAVRRLRRP